jgi:hypothetical protein
MIQQIEINAEISIKELATTGNTIHHGDEPYVLYESLESYV